MSSYLFAMWTDGVEVVTCTISWDPPFGYSAVSCLWRVNLSAVVTPYAHARVAQRTGSTYNSSLDAEPRHPGPMELVELHTHPCRSLAHNSSSECRLSPFSTETFKRSLYNLRKRLSCLSSKLQRIYAVVYCSLTTIYSMLCAHVCVCETTCVNGSDRFPQPFSVSPVNGASNPYQAHIL